mgnify:CR=1 FL=1
MKTLVGGGFDEPPRRVSTSDLQGIDASADVIAAAENVIIETLAAFALEEIINIGEI